MCLYEKHDKKERLTSLFFIFSLDFLSRKVIVTLNKKGLKTK